MTKHVNALGTRVVSAGALGGASTSLKARVNEHEHVLADKLGGVRQLNSGALDAHKGDIKTEHFLLDSKETGANAIIISGTSLTKITREATGEGKFPGIVITVGCVPPTVESEWVCVPISVFAKLLTQSQDGRMESL